MAVRPDPQSETPALPKLWAGDRRRLLSLLVLSGFAQAIAAGGGALLLSSVLHGTGGGRRPLIVALLVVAALVVGLMRMAERVLAERLSQNYVHQLRLGLIRRNLGDGKMRSLGVAVTRTTNDLTSVKNWVSLGVAPLAVGIPLILGAGAALAWLSPWFVVALAAPLVLLMVAVMMLTPIAYGRSRDLRRRRGRLSSQIADSVMATPSIRSAGGSDREMRRIGRRSRSLVTAAVSRARPAGALRGAAAAAAGIASALVVTVGLLTSLPTHSIAGALAVVGFLGTPINDLGRVAEYRQSYRAARRIIAPAINADQEGTTKGRLATPADAKGPLTPLTDGGSGVVLSGIVLSDGRSLPTVRAADGDRILLETGDRRTDSEVMEQIIGLRETTGEVVVHDRRLAEVGPIELRNLVGYAAQGMMLARGTIQRTVRYRSPDASAEDAERQIAAVGLTQRVAELPAGIDTRLVQGGEPLTITERGRLLLARAAFQQPALLLIDHLDADLDADGRTRMRELLSDYPGVVVLTADRADDLVDGARSWCPELAEATPPQPAQEPEPAVRR